MIELRHLRHFVAVAETLHFGRAAQRLHISQPPLSQSIRALEDAVGQALFARASRRVALTAAGDALLPIARGVLAEVARLPHVANAAAAGTRGTLRIVFVSTMSLDTLPRWVREFRAAHGDIEITLREATTDVQLDALRTGDEDVGFVVHTPEATLPSFLAHRLSSEPLLIALPSQHALARAKTLRIEQVLHEPVVMFPRACAPSIHDAIRARYQEHATTPHIAQEAVQMQTILGLVAAGIGLAWVPLSLRRLRTPGIAYRALADGAPSWATSMVWAVDASPLVRHFVAHVTGLRAARSSRTR